MSSLLDHWGHPSTSDWSRAEADARASGIPIHDLITASPLEHDLAYPQEHLAEILRMAPRSLMSYQPDARGHREAREAIATYHGGPALPDQVILPPGTSLS